jgi:hypothetical protein
LMGLPSPSGPVITSSSSCGIRAVHPAS